MIIGRSEAGTTRDFSQEEVEALRQDASTSAALNAARQKAGQRGDDVAVRGDDETLDQRLAEKGTHMSTFEKVELAAQAFEMAGAVGVVPHVHGGVAGAAMGALEVGLPILTLIGTQVALAELQNTKDGLRDAATRDVLRAGMLLSLELPSGFVNAEIGRLGVGTTGQAPAKKVSFQLENTPLGVTVQLHCDQGVHAAEDLAASGKTKAQFFAACPKVAERYATDAAFKAGFDAFEWATKNAPGDAKQMTDDIRARDARYVASHVPVKA